MPMRLGVMQLLMSDGEMITILKSATNNIKHCTNKAAYAERTQKANFIHRACLEPLLY